MFGDYSAPDKYQTIVKVTSDATRDTGVCKGQKSWPITADNMRKLQIVPELTKLKSYDDWLHAIPPLFILLAFCVIGCQQCIERRVEAKELALRIKREGGSIDMKKYFKKSQDKFDKLEYLADLYKLIRENLEEINSQIAENDRRTEEENRDNMNKMLADKHSLIGELRRGKGDTNLEDIRAGLLQMLSNLRFQDGRSLEELYKEQMVQERLEKEQARLEEIDMEVQMNSESDSENKSVAVASEHDSEESDDALAKPDLKDKEDSDSELVSDPALYDDLLKARQQLRKKRDEFEKQIDPSLSQEDRDLIMNRYDDQMSKLEREMVKEQEDQANALKAKLAMRQKMNKHVVEIANDDVAHTVAQIGDLHKQIEELELERDDIEETGINSRGLKKEREAEMKARIQEVEKEKDSRLQQMREDYMHRIKKAKSAADKEFILEEMGERLKSTEDALEEDKRRQEQNLMKLLKARQKKNLKATVKKINKEREELFEQVDRLKVKVDHHKAEVYAEQGVKGQHGLVEDEVAKKVTKIVAEATTVAGDHIQFNGELTEQEVADLEIEKV